MRTADARSKQDVLDEADRKLAAVNRGGSAEGSLLFKDFVNTYFLPNVSARKKASTHKFYRDSLKLHVTPVIGDLRLRDIQTVNVQRMLDDIDLSHASLQRIKTAASAVMSHAIRLGFITGSNPVHEAKPEGRRSDYESYAYGLTDVEWMLERLDEPSRTIVAVAAFTGIREGEIRGLQWSDYTGSELFIRRSVWRKAVGETKTPESKARVPVIRPLRKLLDAHRKTNGTHEWIFAGPKGFSLNLDNLTRRVIRPALGVRFRGWQAFRKGLVGILFDAGVDVEVAKTILRHSDSSVTRRHYLVLKGQQEGKAAMRRIERTLASRGTNAGQKKASRTRNPR
ncbi:MAG: tyrosine-type recombinase/integrase [Terriglobales bacterium]